VASTQYYRMWQAYTTKINKNSGKIPGLFLKVTIQMHLLYTHWKYYAFTHISINANAISYMYHARWCILRQRIVPHGVISYHCSTGLSQRGKENAEVANDFLIAKYSRICRRKNARVLLSQFRNWRCSHKLTARDKQSIDIVGEK